MNREDAPQNRRPESMRELLDASSLGVPVADEVLQSMTQDEVDAIIALAERRGMYDVDDDKPSAEPRRAKVVPIGPVFTAQLGFYAAAAGPDDALPAITVLNAAGEQQLTFVTGPVTAHPAGTPTAVTGFVVEVEVDPRRTSPDLRVIDSAGGVHRPRIEDGVLTCTLPAPPDKGFDVQFQFATEYP